MLNFFLKTSNIFATRKQDGHTRRIITVVGSLSTSIPECPTVASFGLFPEVSYRFSSIAPCREVVASCILRMKLMGND